MTLTNTQTEQLREEWRPVVGYEKSYKVSNWGNVQSLDRTVRGPYGSTRTRRGKLLVPFENGCGYKSVSLHGGVRKRETMRVHRLVAQAFIENPDDSPYVNHIDGNKTNNLVSNLEWCTPIENNIHAVNTGLIDQKGQRNTQSKLNSIQVRIIRRLRQFGYGTDREIGKLFGVTKSNVWHLCSDSSWRHI